MVRIKERILLAVVLGLALYAGIYTYALHSAAFQFVARSVQDSKIIQTKVGADAKVSLPLFGYFREKFVDSEEIVTLSINVVGNRATLPLVVVVARKNGIWKIESVSIDGTPIDLN